MILQRGKPFVTITGTDLNFLVRMCEEAGQVALRMQPGVVTDVKNDGSLVTAADVQVERFVANELGRRFPMVPIVGEETGGIDKAGDVAFFVDPIDGTASYARGGTDWCVSVGLVSKGISVAGVVVAPAWGVTWYGAQGMGAYRLNERIRRPPTVLNRHSLVAMATAAVRHYGPPPEHYGHLRCLGGIALHVVLCADGRIDAAVNSNWSVWDIAGAAAVLLEAGGKLVTAEGQDARNLLTCSGEADLIAGGPNIAHLVPVPLPHWNAEGA
jgi:myo-inositol-1(or 4)-monophosphatase